MWNIFKFKPFILASVLFIITIIAASIYYFLPGVSSLFEKDYPMIQVGLKLDVLSYLKTSANNKDDSFYKVFNEVENEADKNPSQDVLIIIKSTFQKHLIPLSLYYPNSGENEDKIIEHLHLLTSKALDRNCKIVSDRLEKYEFIDVSITKQNGWQILLTLRPKTAKGNDEQLIQTLISKSAFLEFRLVKDAEFTFPLLQKIDSLVAGRIRSGNLDPLESEFINYPTPALSKSSKNFQEEKEPLSESEFKLKHPFFTKAILNPQSPYADAFIDKNETELIQFWLGLPEVKAIMPDNVEFIFSFKPWISNDGKEIFTLYLVNKTSELTGEVILDAKANIDPYNSSHTVDIKMNSEGTVKWARVTSLNIGKRIAIILDEVVYAAPLVKSKIPGGRSLIEGIENLEDAKLLEIMLNAGALEAPWEIVSKKTQE